MSREQDDFYMAPGMLDMSHPVHQAADTAFNAVLNVLDLVPGGEHMNALLIVWAPSDNPPGTVDQTLVACGADLEGIASRLTSALERLLEPEVFDNLARALARREREMRGHE